LFANLGPGGHGLAKRFIFLGDPPAQLLDVNATSLASQLALGAPELVVKHGPLDFEPGNAL